MGGKIGNVEPRQDRLRGPRIIVGRAADEREAGERHQRINDGLAVLQEEGLDRGAGIEPAGKGRHHLQPARFERCDHAVIMGGVLGEQVGAQKEEADCPDRPCRAGKPGGLCRQPAGKLRVIDAHLGIRAGRPGLKPRAQPFPRARGVAAGKRANHLHDIVVGAGQPILQRQEIGAHILRGARQEAQQLGQPAEHAHLPSPGIRARLRRPAQPLEKRKRSGGRRIHAIAAKAGEPHHLAARHEPEDRVALLAAGLELRQHGADMVLEEEHRDDEDVGTCDIGVAAGEPVGVAVPVGGGVEADLDPVGCKGGGRALDGTGKVIVERDDDGAQHRHAGPATAGCARIGLHGRPPAPRWALAS